jgi:hypothetical protein
VPLQQAKSCCYVTARLATGHSRSITGSFARARSKPDFVEVLRRFYPRSHVFGCHLFLEFCHAVCILAPHRNAADCCFLSFVVEGNPFDAVKVRNAGLEAAAAAARGGMYRWAEGYGVNRIYQRQCHCSCASDNQIIVIIIIIIIIVTDTISPHTLPPLPPYTVQVPPSPCFPLTDSQAGPWYVTQRCMMALASREGSITLHMPRDVCLQIQLVREYCRANSKRQKDPVVATARKSQGASATKSGKKGWNETHARDCDVHEADVKEVTCADACCLHAACRSIEILGEFRLQHIKMTLIRQVMAALISKALHALLLDQHVSDISAQSSSHQVAVVAAENMSSASGLVSSLTVELNRLAHSAAGADCEAELNCSQDERTMLEIACSIREHPSRIIFGN